ncbi:unnamed protein product, partial [Meganyctiphanes norvegica]
MGAVIFILVVVCCPRGGDAECLPVVDEDHSWDGGWDGSLEIPVATAVNEWEIELTFDIAPDSLICWTGAVSPDGSSDTYTIGNMDFDGDLPAGETFKLPFQYVFTSGTPMPTIQTVSWNGMLLCEGDECLGCVTGPTQPTTSTTSTTTTPATTTTTTPYTGPSTTAPPTLPPTTRGPGCDDTPYDYDEVLHASFLFYEAQRSGKLPADHRVPWRGDSATNDGSDVGLDLSGGYYDAGDFVKFGFPMAGSVTNLAWGGVEYKDAYEASGEMGWLKSTVKWGTDYFIKAHPEPTVFYGQCGNGGADHAWWGRPEEMTMNRPSYKITSSSPGSELAGETASALAAASILFADSDPDYSAECLEHAKDLYDFADKHRGKYSDSISDASGYYNSWGGYNDELVWSAAWLYYATGDDSYLSAAESAYVSGDLGDASEFSWDDKTVGAQVLLYQFTEKSTYKTAVSTFCDYVTDEVPYTPKGLAYISQWGPLRYAANAALICLRAGDLGIDTEKNYDFARQQINYMLGDAGHSYVIGFGTNSPKRPHHRSSSCPDLPAPCDWGAFSNSGPNPQELTGALVGGPKQDDSYTDDRGDYVSNEVATDYNAAFTSAVAAIRHLDC